MRCFALLLVLCFCPPWPASAQAAPAGDALLWTHDIQWTGGLLGVATSLSPRLEIRDPNAPSPVALATIFAWLDLDAGDSGRVFSADQTSDADWQRFSHYLTDGAPNQLRIALRFSSGSGIGSQFTGPEFPGLIVTRADLRLGTLTIVSPGSNPNGDGQWTD